MRRQPHCDRFRCPVEACLDLIGGKWKAVILFHLLGGTKRFNELRRLLPKITQRMLTRQLRELEADTLIERRVYPEVPPKVEYRLSEFGRTLEPIVRTLAHWGAKHLDRIGAIRQASAPRPPAPRRAPRPAVRAARGR